MDALMYRVSCAEPPSPKYPLFTILDDEQELKKVRIHKTINASVIDFMLWGFIKMYNTSVKLRIKRLFAISLQLFSIHTFKEHFINLLAICFTNR